MSRTSRALIAGGAALALLAGSGATFARWYDEKPITTGSVTTGTLSLEMVGQPDWKINTAAEDENIDDPSVAFDPATEKLTPGDVVTMTQKVKIHAQGKNLKATMAYIQGNGDLPSDVDVSVVPECAGTTLDQITQAQDNQECTVKTTIAYKFGADNSHAAVPEFMGDGTHADNGDEHWVNPSDKAGKGKPAAMGQQISLADGKLVLEQNKRPQP